MSVLLSAVVMVVSSCAMREAEQTVAESGVPQELLDRLNSHCTELEAPLLGEGTLCVDSGFRLKVDDFSFANYGRSQSADANVTVQTLVDLFGHSSVCMPGDDTRCVLRPTALQKLEEWNNAIAGGRCEGFSTLSTRFQLGIERPVEYRTDVAQVADFRKSDAQVQSSIVYWWATQFLREVSDRAAASRAKSPLALVDDLIVGIANRVGYTLALYSKDQGHSVTPFAVTRRAGTFVVHVYDNNFPGERKEVVVDATTNTWAYADASPDQRGDTATWTGGTGTIEITPMSARQGPFECWFCTMSDVSADSPTVISLASRDARSPGYVRITTRSGAVIEATPDGVDNAIPGAVYSVSKGGAAGLVSVTIPASAGDLDVEVRRASASIPAGDVVLTLRQPGAASIQVAGNLAETVAGTEGSGSPVLSVRGGDTTVSTPPGRVARVTTAAGSNLSRTVLEPGQSLMVSAVADNAIEVAVKGSNGMPMGTVAIGTDGSSDASVVVLTPNPATNTVATSSTSITSVSVQKNSQNSAATTDTTTTTVATTTTVRTPVTTTSVPTIEVTQPGRKSGRSTTTTVPKKKPPRTTTTTTSIAPTTTIAATTTTVGSEGQGNNGNNGNNGQGNNGNNGNNGQGNNG